METNVTNARSLEAKETMDVLLEMATIMNTGLDRETLSICVALCEAGVNPEALAAVIKELRAEARSQRNTTSAFSRS
ncbi:Mitotic-spindle organizing protein 1 [Coelomomyces lativittatus]|nr:Mitotic-spindle organizing protein 1 [Coelomomyces lativittatus]KAJ1511194.1 Mitotic-spindle organizing protein 1 [Coelomomyces lativittatus]